MRPERFRDRRHAGRVLATALSGYAGRGDVLVLALPRGGVPVAFEIAAALVAPLDVFVVRKLGVPDQEELAMGALASGGVLLVDADIVRALAIERPALEAVIARESEELARREHAYRSGRPPIDVHGRLVVLVDDGLATGTTMRAAIAGLRQLEPREVVVAVPVAAPAVCEEVGGLVDRMICAVTPENLYAVGLWYADFTQTSDEEVRELLKESTWDRTSTRYGSP